MSSLAAAALIGWEWWPREIDIFATFEVTHYRPKDRPNAVRVVHENSGEESWIPLFDNKGVPLYPEVMSELVRRRCRRLVYIDTQTPWGVREEAI